MQEEGAEGIDGNELQEGALQDQIGHWVKVLDRWVKELDRRMGRQSGDDRSQTSGDDFRAEP